MLQPYIPFILLLGTLVFSVVVFVSRRRQSEALETWRTWARSAGYSIEEHLLPGRPRLEVAGVLGGSSFSVGFWVGNGGSFTLVRLQVPDCPEELGVCRKRLLLPFRKLWPRLVSSGDAWMDANCAVMASDDAGAQAFLSQRSVAGALRGLLEQEPNAVLERRELLVGRPGVAEVAELERLVRRLGTVAQRLRSNVA